METTLRWTSADLEVLPDDGKHYEIVDGELYVSRQPSWHHQHACLKLLIALDVWNPRSNTGVVNIAPGMIFADDDDVTPDGVWISHERLAPALDWAAPDISIQP